jgi:hypothetical protein
MTSATSSSSWMANRPVPRREFCTAQATSSVTTAAASTIR